VSPTRRSPTFQTRPTRLDVTHLRSQCVRWRCLLHCEPVAECTSVGPRDSRTDSAIASRRIDVAGRYPISCEDAPPEVVDVIGRRVDRGPSFDFVDREGDPSVNGTGELDEEPAGERIDVHAVRERSVAEPLRGELTMERVVARVLVTNRFQLRDQLRLRPMV